jgi:hypothetical protein
MTQNEMVDKYIDEQLSLPDMARNAIQSGMGVMSGNMDRSMQNTNNALSRVAANITTIAPSITNN